MTDAAVIREALQTRADGALLVSLHADGTETVFCGDQDGEYVGWQERLYADSKGWTYRADADDAAIAALAALDALATSREVALRERDVALDRITTLESEVAQLREDMEWIAERCSALVGLTGANEYAASSIESRARAKT